MQDGARAFWVTAPGRGEIRDEALGTPSADEVVVETLYSGISRGTEALVFSGRIPRSEWSRMRAPFQSGEFPAPVKYGYSCVGRVVDGPDALRGRTVFVLYPHQTRFIVPGAAVHVVPDGIPPGRAVLAANLETALNGVWDARPHVGDRIAVIGAGTVGCLAAWLASRIPGCDVELVDINPRRADVARAVGVRFADPAMAAREADLVIHASGAPAGLELALQLAGLEATIVELSWFGDETVSLPLGGAFHARRLTITASQVGRVAPAQRPRWDTRRRMSLALALLQDPALDVLITGESAFESLPDVMARLTQSPGDELCHRVRYS
jgi:2-desacetyl-2-hydroxyethyl bacteriochlorophyllide A dehydrogenase